MRKKILVVLATGAISIVMLSSLSGAATLDIAVTAAGDRVNGRQWYYGGSDTWTDVGANPNQVSHSYTPGWGDSRSTALSFDLTSLNIPVADIVSASFNFNIESIWTEGRDDVGNLDNVGTVYNSGGTGWKAFDVTDSLKAILSGGNPTTANYNFAYTGYSGFTFSSAEGGNPAFLRIATASVPEPASLLLIGTGLVGLVAARRKKQD